MNPNFCNTLVYPYRYFVEDLTRAPPDGAAICWLRCHETVGENRWLVTRPPAHDATTYARLRAEALAQGRPSPAAPAGHYLLRVFRTDNPPPVAPAHLAADLTADAHLYAGAGAWAGAFSGWLRTPASECLPFDQIQRWEPFRAAPRVWAQPTENSRFKQRYPTPAQSEYAAFLRGAYAQERWSRTIGALGAETWRQLNLLRYAVIGAGRGGQIIAHELAQLGVGQLTLIDPDTLALHNLGEMAGLSDDTLGRPKAEALAQGLDALLPRVPAQRRGLAASVYRSAPALQAAAQADVLICWTDQDSARFFAGLVAAHYHRVLLDIGAGVAVSPERQRGADIRLFVPGEGCLLCFGGVHSQTGALEEIINPARAAERRGPDWRQQRAGSLRTLNLKAASEALEVLIAWLDGKVTGNVWRRLESGGENHAFVAPVAPPQTQAAPTPDCMCRLAGQADLLPTTEKFSLEV